MSPSPRAGAGAGIHWEAHGRLLTACLVTLNVFLVLLVYVYFWRFFSRSRSGGEDDADAEGASSVASSPPASPKARDRREVELAITAMPIFVHSSSSSGGGATGGGGPAAAECAICIAEFADGDKGRLLPRCGHRFHARCVDTWFRFHTTCPLCRTTVLAAAVPPPSLPPLPAVAQTANQPPQQHHTDTNSSDDADTDYSPV